MTWDRIKATGRGELAFRVKVGGLDYEFVTNHRMVQDVTDTTGTAAGGIVKRRLGLKREGLRIQEEAILPENRIELGGNSFTIVDDHEQSATRAFLQRARKRTYLLNTSISSTTTNFRITTLAGFSAGDFMWIGSECMRLTAAPLLTGAGFDVFVQRGKLGTIAQRHFARTDLGEVLRPTFQDVPYGIETRRVTLYAYGDGDDFQGDGQVIWRGIVTQEAALPDGIDWRFEAGPITEVLKGEIGNGFEDLKFRGIYFSLREWKVEFQRLDGPLLGSVGPASPLIGPSIACTGSGFYETKWDLATDLHNQLVTASRRTWSDSNTNMGCQIIDGELLFTYTTDASEPSGVFATTGEGIRDVTTFSRDGSRPLYEFHQFQPLPLLLENTFDASTGTDSFRFRDTGRLLLSAPTDSTLAIRTVLPIPDILAPYYSGIPAVTFGRDPQRMHVSADSLSDKLNDVAVYRKADEETSGTGTGGTGGGTGGDAEDVLIGRSVPRDTITVDLTNRTVTAQLYRNFVATNEDTYMAAGTTFERDGNVVDFIQKLIEISPDLANQGYCPLIGPDDFDLDSMKTVISGVSLNVFAAHRRYSFFKKGPTLEEVLQPEFKLIGCYPALTPEGKLTIRPFRQITSRETAVHSLGADDILTDDTFPPLISNKYGIWNSVSLKTRYDPQSEEHLGTEFIVNNLDSISQNSGKRKTIEIAPKSFSVLAQIPIEEIIEPFLWKETGILAFRYWVTALDVSMTMFSSSIGDTVRISSRQLPNPFLNASRRRGTSVLGGVIVGREFDLAAGFGRIQILLSEENITGELTAATGIYSPGIPFVSSSTDGATLIIPIPASEIERLFGAGEDMSDHFRVGDRVCLRERDADDPDTSGVGTVTSVGIAEIDIEFAAADEIPDGVGTGEDFSLGFASLAETTGTLSASATQVTYAIVDSGSHTADESEVEGYPAGDHDFFFSP